MDGAVLEDGAARKHLRKGFHLQTDEGVSDFHELKMVVDSAFIQPDTIPLGIVGVEPAAGAVAAEEDRLLLRSHRLDVAVAIDPDAGAGVEIDLRPGIDDQSAERVHCRIAAVNDVGEVVGPVRHLVLVRDDFVTKGTAALIRHDEVRILPVCQQVHILHCLPMPENDGVGDEERL